MEIKKINDDIHLIKLGGLESNIYLIKKKVLIDTGLGYHKKMLEEALDSLDIKFTDIERIIFTHAHYDHIGGKNLFTNAKTAIHKDDASILKQGDSTKSCAFAFKKTLKPKEADLILNDNDIIRIDDMKLDIIHTPGHTEGSICLHDENSKILFTGDTIFSDTIGRTDLPGSNEKNMIESLNKLKDLEISKILPGHGNIIDTDAEKQIDKIIQMYTD
ncbi:MAG: MBL fold metallo-hydrolase [Candidatus Aenigmarchaeota archaeon]|nr:MBL fold metallo-hydrolase [Candidatus Aenigmarchaeota archaeon]